MNTFSMVIADNQKNCRFRQPERPQKICLEYDYNVTYLYERYLYTTDGHMEKYGGGRIKVVNLTREKATEGQA